MPKSSAIIVKYSLDYYIKGVNRYAVQPNFVWGFVINSYWYRSIGDKWWY